MHASPRMLNSLRRRLSCPRPKVDARGGGYVSFSGETGTGGSEVRGRKRKGRTPNNNLRLWSLVPVPKISAPIWCCPKGLRSEGHSSMKHDTLHRTPANKSLPGLVFTVKCEKGSVQRFLPLKVHFNSNQINTYEFPLSLFLHTYVSRQTRVAKHKTPIPIFIARTNQPQLKLTSQTTFQYCLVSQSTRACASKQPKVGCRARYSVSPKYFSYYLFLSF